MIRKTIVKTKRKKAKVVVLKSTALTPIEEIEQRIFALRGQRVLLDQDLAQLYGVQLKRLNEQVKRNRDRFPEDFTFRLTFEEGKAVRAVRSQNATLQNPPPHLRFAPYVFTEHGAMMLANVLKSPRAARTSIQIVRAFVRFRQLLAWSNRIEKKVEVLERRLGKHDADLQDIVRALRELLAPPPMSPKRMIGFLAGLSAKPIQRDTAAKPPTSLTLLKKSKGAGTT